MSGQGNDRSGKLGAGPRGFDPRQAAAGATPQRRRPRGAATDLGGLDRMVGFVLRRAQMWMTQDFRRALKDVDMTPAQFSVLRIIAANPGLAQARVAEALAIERARLVQMIDDLEAAGRVTRTRSATDRRSHELHLTPTGADLLERARSAVEAHERHVAERLGVKEKEELLRILGPHLT